MRTPGGRGAIWGRLEGHAGFSHHEPIAAATNPPPGKPQRGAMRTLVLNGVLAAAALLLAGCSAYLAGDMGFAPSPMGSSGPRPHG